jgi:hypothetical protein
LGFKKACFDNSATLWLKNMRLFSKQYSTTSMSETPKVVKVKSDGSFEIKHVENLDEALEIIFPESEKDGLTPSQEEEFEDDFTTPKDDFHTIIQ